MGFITKPGNFNLLLCLAFVILLYQCVLLTWQNAHARHIENNLIEALEKSYVSISEDGMTKIYWAVNGMKQDDPVLIDFIRDNVLVKPSHPSSSGTNSNLVNMGGQMGQPFEVEKLLGLNSTRKGRNGFFIEAGAADGETISNTLYFETKFGWNGLLVEPNPNLLKKLYSKHRKAYVLPHCLSTKPEVEIVTFDDSGFVSGIIVEGKIRPSKVGDAMNALKTEKSIQVQCFPLYSILMALGNPHVDYFSLDIEGAELAMLKTLPWDKIKMTLIDVEINHAGMIFPGSREDIHSFMFSHGYPFIKSVSVDDFFFNKENNKFL